MSAGHCRWLPTDSRRQSEQQHVGYNSSQQQPAHQSCRVWGTVATEFPEPLALSVCRTCLSSSQIGLWCMWVWLGRGVYSVSPVTTVCVMIILPIGILCVAFMPGCAPAGSVCCLHGLSLLAVGFCVGSLKAWWSWRFLRRGEGSSPLLLCLLQQTKQQRLYGPLVGCMQELWPVCVFLVTQNAPA